MATSASGGIKDFYKQRKKSGISKSNGGAKPSSRKSQSPANAASLGSDVIQPPTLISHGSPDLKDDYGERENMLRQFDMNMAYGPCLGITRIGRWERACKLGLNPPKDIEALLKAGAVQSECLWNGRV